MDAAMIKSEFPSHAYCSACLSSNRKLTGIGTYIDIFTKICDNINVEFSHIKFCWECVTLFKKIYSFKKKVTNAQRILQFHYSCKEKIFPKSLSTLSTSKTEITNAIFKKELTSPDVKTESDQDEPFDNDNIFISINTTNDCIDQKYDEQIQNDIKPLVNDDDESVTQIKKTLDDNFETQNDIKVEIELHPVKKKVKKEKLKCKKRNIDYAKVLKTRSDKYRFIDTNVLEIRDSLIRKIPVDVNEMNSLMKTQKNVFSKAMFKCDNCVEFWNCESELLHHNKICHDESIGSYSCSVCHMRFKTESALDHHTSEHRYKRECKICLYQCYGEGVMVKHLSKHNKEVQCLACGLCFETVRPFYQHHKELHGILLCDLCGKKCKSKQIMEKHLRIHFGHKCEVCNRSFHSSKRLKYHLIAHHTSASEQSYCVSCDKQFRTVIMLQTHLRNAASHRRERDGGTRNRRTYPCPECGNVYQRLTNMTNHYKHVHLKKTNYHCQLCDQYFLNNTRLNTHMRYKHIGVERNRICKICGRGFAELVTLRNHIRTHTDERPHACPHCDRRFNQKHAMKVHLKTHLQKEAKDIIKR